MKTLITVRRTDGSTIDKNRIKVYTARIEAVRKASGLFVGAVKGAHLGGSVADNAVHYAQSIVKDARTHREQEMNKTRFFNEISRVIYGEKVSSSYSDTEGMVGRKDALTELRRGIRRMRERARERYDKLADKKPNGVLLKYHSRVLSQTKRPKDGDAYVGVEIECILPENADMTRLVPFGKWLNVTTDGSIEYGDDEMGREIRVCVKRSEVREVLPGICKALASMGARVNRSCGLHVHLDQRNVAQPELNFQKLVRSLGLLYTVIPASRRENTYCKRNRHAQFSVAANGNRYRAVNATAFYKHSTLEVRLFGGTIDANKIINWIEVLHGITDGVSVNRCPKNFDTAQQYWKLSPENVEWLKKRQTKFGLALADDVEAQSDIADVTLEMAHELEQREVA